LQRGALPRLLLHHEHTCLESCNGRHIYEAPPNSNATTKELFAEIAAIRQLVPENLVSIIISPDQLKQYWKVINEETSSSKSDIHFGHYIVGSKSDIIFHYHAS
jgi:hypothetical protein